MMRWVFQDVAMALGSILPLVAAFEIGFRGGRRSATSRDSGVGQIGAVQAATLGLLGLLLAFSFAGAGARFLERQDLIVAEANAIETSYLRSDLLNEPHRTALKDALREYTTHRLRVSASLRGGLHHADLEEFNRNLSRVWTAAIEGVREKELAAMPVLGPVNEVIDLNTLRLAAGRKHIPLVVIGLLFACSLMAMSIIGYGFGVSKRRYLPVTMSLTILIGVALFITLDLDHPRAGILRLNDAPLKELTFD